MEVPRDEAERLAVRLRQLPVVEPFPARGLGAANVHEATRLALRARMKVESPERLRALSTGARACFVGDAAPHARIEALYHRLTAEPEAAAWECAALNEEWDGAGCYEALLGLGVVLDELLQEGLPEGLVRGAALYWLARIRFDYRPLGITAAQARAALEEYQRSGDDRFIAMSQELLGGVVLAQGDFPHANRQAPGRVQPGPCRLAARPLRLLQQSRRCPARPGRPGRGAGRIPRRPRHRRAPGRAGPGPCQLAARPLRSHNKVGEVLYAQGDPAGALAEYRAGLAIRERLAAQGLANAQWQTDLAISCGRIAEALLALPEGDRTEARRLLARGLT